MKTAFEVLEVDEGADDQAIKAAYLAKVRQFPPEQAPREFQRIRTAFEAISTERRRAAYYLFHCELPNIDELAEILIDRKSSTRPAEKTMKKMLAESLATYKLPLE